MCVEREIKITAEAVKQPLPHAQVSVRAMKLRLTRTGISHWDNTKERLSRARGFIHIYSLFPFLTYISHVDLAPFAKRFLLLVPW